MNNCATFLHVLSINKTEQSLNYCISMKKLIKGGQIYFNIHNLQKRQTNKQTNNLALEIQRTIEYQYL